MQKLVSKDSLKCILIFTAERVQSEAGDTKTENVFFFEKKPSLFCDIQTLLNCSFLRAKSRYAKCFLLKKNRFLMRPCVIWCINDNILFILMKWRCPKPEIWLYLHQWGSTAVYWISHVGHLFRFCCINEKINLLDVTHFQNLNPHPD